MKGQQLCSLDEVDNWCILLLAVLLSIRGRLLLEEVVGGPICTLDN